MEDGTPCVRALLVTIEDDAVHYSTIRARVVNCNERGQSIRGCSHSEWDYDYTGGRSRPSDQALADFAVTAVLSRTEPAPYSERCEYRRPYDVTPRRAEQMVRTFRSVARALAAAERKDGPPDTFGRYLARVARALGATLVLFEAYPPRRGPDGSPLYEVRQLGPAIERMNELARSWRQEREPVTVCRGGAGSLAIS